jgi:hypothetical protein
MSTLAVAWDVSGGWYEDYCRGLWIMRKPCRIRFGLDGSRWDVIDPATPDQRGMVCDLFSIPKPVRWLWARNRGIGNICARAHDFTRRHRDMLQMTVMESDLLFLAMMRMAGMPEAGLFYAAVRAGAYMGATGIGDGTPPRDVRAAMESRGDDWRAYAARVRAANPCPRMG